MRGGKGGREGAHQVRTGEGQRECGGRRRKTRKEEVGGRQEEQREGENRGKREKMDVADVHWRFNTTYQLPVEGSSGESSVFTDHPAVVLGLSSDAQSLSHLTQIDEVQKLVLCIVTASL